MGEKGGSSTTDGGAFRPRLFFCCFFSSAVTASIRCLTSSSRSSLSELEYSLCFPFSILMAIEASEQCNREMQTENACNADNRAWKSTKNCPFPFAFMERAGSSSLLPCFNSGCTSQLFLFGVRSINWWYSVCMLASKTSSRAQHQAYVLSKVARA